MKSIHFFSKLWKLINEISNIIKPKIIISLFPLSFPFHYLSIYPSLSFCLFLYFFPSFLLSHLTFLFSMSLPISLFPFYCIFLLFFPVPILSSYFSSTSISCLIFWMALVIPVDPKENTSHSKNSLLDRQQKACTFNNFLFSKPNKWYSM